MELFKHLNIETSSLCNRRCKTCIRNSYPDKKEVSNRFTQNLLDIGTIIDILIESIKLGFVGDVCLSHYNEPLLDPRIVEIAETARLFPQFSYVYFHSNGDNLTPELASQLDGKLDRIVFSLYMEEQKNLKRKEWIKSLFKKTKIDIIIDKHITTHFSPNPDLLVKIRDYSNANCTIIRNGCIIDFRGNYLLCCEDLAGEFDLGRFPEVSVRDYWFGEKHSQIIADLGNTNSRSKYPYCSICPKS